MTAYLNHPIINALIYSNLWIALCALALCQSTYLISGQSMQFDALTLLVFFATTATYALARLMGLRNLSENVRQKLWYGRNDWLMKTQVVLSGFACAVLFFYLKFSVQIALIIGAIVILLYSLPLLPRSGKWVRLRDIGQWKIFLIAISWGMTTAVLPIFNIGIEHYGGFSGALIFLIERMLFIFAITLPFDIRDMHYDADFGLTTLPHLIGIRNTQHLSYLCLLIASFLSFLWSWHTANFHFPNVIAIGSCYLFCAYLISLSHRQHQDQFFTGIIDGSMILLFLLLLISSSLFI